MQKAFKGGATGMALVLGLLGHSAPALANPADAVALRVIVVNEAGVPSAVLEQAKAEAAAIFSRIAVQITWLENGAQTSAATGTHPYVLNIVPKTLSSTGEGANAMGVAPAAEKPGARLAYAFYGAVEKVAREHDIDVAVLLGDVIAHELGHLLLPFPSHSAAGIMYGGWDAEQLRLVSRGVLRFSKAQATELRGRLAQNQR